MPPKVNSVRSLARELGISHTTVSDALRDNPRVKSKTRRMVQRAAREFGYKYNPLAGAVMSGIRRSTIGAFQGTLAIVDLEPDENHSSHANPYHKLVMEGARETAGRLGFKVDHFQLGEQKIPVSRLNGILHSRGIRAALFLPVSGKPDISHLDWENLTGIYTDYLIDSPAIHTVCPNHFRSMAKALQKLIDLGYRRPGLVLSKAHDRRLLFRWEAAFLAFLKNHDNREPTPPLVTNGLTREIFLQWFHETKPDVVMCHHPEVLFWMKESGCRVPETHGYCCLNVVSAQLNASGLDLMPRLCGSRAMEALIAQLQRNEYGIPEIPLTSTYPAKWLDGPTLRNLAEGR